VASYIEVAGYRRFGGPCRLRHLEDGGWYPAATLHGVTIQKTSLNLNLNRRENPESRTFSVTYFPITSLSFPYIIKNCRWQNVFNDTGLWGTVTLCLCCQKIHHHYLHSVDWDPWYVQTPNRIFKNSLLKCSVTTGVSSKWWGYISSGLYRSLVSFYTHTKNLSLCRSVIIQFSIISLLSAFWREPTIVALAWPSVARCQGTRGTRNSKVSFQYRPPHYVTDLNKRTFQTLKIACLGTAWPACSVDWSKCPSGMAQRVWKFFWVNRWTIMITFSAGPCLLFPMHYYCGPVL